MIDGHRRHGTTAEPTQPEMPLTRSQRVGRAVVGLGVSADAITAAGVVLAGATAVVVALGHLYLGVILLAAGGLMDTLDGIVAKAAGSASPRGAFVDSVADRVSDGLVLGGVTWHLLVSSQPRWAILPLAVLGVSALISYERAKAESLGYLARGGLMERAERLILLGVALLFHIVLIPLLVVLLVLSTGTAIGRFVRVWHLASAPTNAVADEHRQWRTWRHASARSAARRTTRPRKELRPLTLRLSGAWSASRATNGSPRRDVGTRRSARAWRDRLSNGH